MKATPLPELRIAFVSGLGMGGATTLLCNLAEELLRRKIAVKILSLESENAFASDFMAMGIEVITQDDQQLIFEDRMSATLKALAEFQPSVVVACLGASSYEVLRYLPTGVVRAGMIQADHEMFYSLAALYSSFFDLLIGVSLQIQETLQSKIEFHGIPTSWLTSGVKFPAVSEEANLSEPLRILYLGRLIQGQKRVHLFPEIYRGLCQSGIPFSWTIAGDGEEKEFLKAEMRPARADQVVRIIDKVDYQEVPALMNNHDVFLLASDCEGLPISLMEAMSFGLVPVISDLPSGVRQVVNPSNGMLVPPDQIEGYAKAILQLHRDRQLLQGMRLNARRIIHDEFSVQAMAEKWISILSKHLNPSQPWPTNTRIKPIIGFEGTLKYLPFLRPLRRMALWLGLRRGGQQLSSPS